MHIAASSSGTQRSTNPPSTGEDWVKPRTSQQPRKNTGLPVRNGFDGFRGVSRVKAAGVKDGAPSRSTKPKRIMAVQVRTSVPQRAADRIITTIIPTNMEQRREKLTFADLAKK